VHRLVQDLEARNLQVEVFYDMLLPAGSSWVETLAREIERADVILAVLSPDYLASEWAAQEVNVALDRTLKGSSRLIPLMVRPCHPPGFLSQLVWIDFTGDYEEALARLIWGVTGERPRAAIGQEPGVPTQTIEPTELEKLRQEVHEAVRLFKSRDEGHHVDRQVASQPDVAKHRCFVVMPFGDPELQAVYEYFVKPTLETECQLLCERGDDVFGSNVIMDDILRSIKSATIVLADLTKKNANVFYEVGICHALGKPVLLLAQSIEDVPFDLRHRRVLIYEYTPPGCKQLERKLKENVLPMLRGEPSGETPA
jgi:TIR domain